MYPTPGRTLKWLILCSVSLTSSALYAQGNKGSATAAKVPAPVDSMQYYNDTKRPAISDTSIVEYAPTIQADGRTIIFEAQEGNGFKLFESKFNGTEWGKGVPLTRINQAAGAGALIGGPSISFDGNTLYFFKDGAADTGMDIFVSKRLADGWGEAVSLGAPVNSAGYEAFPSISADGKSLYFVRINKDGPRSKIYRKAEMFCTSVFRSVLDSLGKWSVPEKLPWPVNLDCEKAPRIMADGRTLIFSSNRPGGKGGFDMYQTRLNELGEWTAPENLAFVNSASDDILPCISAKGDMMYYTYDARDIFSVVIPPKLRQFANTVIQGFVTDEDTKSGVTADIVVTDAVTSQVFANLASNGDDGRFTVVLPAGRKFVLDFRSAGYSNFTYTLDLRKSKAYSEVPLDVKLFRSAFVSLTITDKDLFEPLAATVTVSDDQGKKVRELTSKASDGKVRIEVPLGGRYRIDVQVPRYQTGNMEFNIANLVYYRNFEKFIELQHEKVEVQLNISDRNSNARVKSKVVLRNTSRDEVIEVDGNQPIQVRTGDRYEVEVTSDQGYAFNSTVLDLSSGNAVVPPVDIALMKLEKNALLELKDIVFEYNSAQLSDVSFVELDRVVKLIRENPTLKVQIDAHTDDVGSDVNNLILSNKRAKSVMDYLITAQVPVSRVSSKGFGEAAPKHKNDTPENRALNRRVEIRVIGI